MLKGKYHKEVREFTQEIDRAMERRHNEMKASGGETGQILGALSAALLNQLSTIRNTLNLIDGQFGDQFIDECCDLLKSNRAANDRNIVKH